MSKEYLQITSETDNYPIRISIIYFLLVITFSTAGIIAFVFDQITLPGRYEIGFFEGIHAHVVGSICFLLSAYWTSLIMKERQRLYIAPKLPYVIAVIAISALWWKIYS